MFDVFLIAHAPDRVTVALKVADAGHSGVKVVQAAGVRPVATELGSTPKEDTAAEIVVAAVVVASG